MTNELRKRVKNWAKKIYARDNSCADTCLLLAKQVGKATYDWYLVEGEYDGSTHYWLEDEEGNVVDPQYYIIDINYELINPTNRDMDYEAGYKWRVGDLLGDFEREDYKKHCKNYKGEEDFKADYNLRRNYKEMTKESLV